MEMSRIGFLDIGGIGLQINLSTGNPGALDLALAFDVMGINRVRIVGEFDEIGEFPYLNRSEISFSSKLMRAVDGVCSQCLVDGDCLIGPVNGP
jgi:hypothetical protein